MKKNIRNPAMRNVRHNFPSNNAVQINFFAFVDGLLKFAVLTLLSASYFNDDFLIAPNLLLKLA